MPESTVLKNRVLWYDGSVEVSTDQACELFLRGVAAEKIIIGEMNEDVELYNMVEDVPLRSAKESCAPLDYSWNLPPKYAELQVHEVIIDRLAAFLKEIPEEMQLRYITRVELELEEINSRGLLNLFRALVYVMDTFKKNDVVWGVGRGSSCACFCLYLLGVHLIDPVKFDIPLEEFFHD